MSDWTCDLNSLKCGNLIDVSGRVENADEDCHEKKTVAMAGSVRVDEKEYIGTNELSVLQ